MLLRGIQGCLGELRIRGTCPGQYNSGILAPRKTLKLTEDLKCQSSSQSFHLCLFKIEGGDTNLL